MQLECSDTETAYFAVLLEEGEMYMEKIAQEQQFWEQKCFQSR
jgi:hypothetical protein